MNKHRHKRERVEILYDILVKCAERPTSKTRLVYKTNINFQMANLYIRDLYSAGLVENDNNRYYCTQLGMEWLRTMERAIKMVERPISTPNNKRINSRYAI
jgi:predicted transcriptional regulator